MKIPADRRNLGRSRIFRETFVAELANAQILDAEDYKAGMARSGLREMATEAARNKGTRRDAFQDAVTDAGELGVYFFRKRILFPET